MNETQGVVTVNSDIDNMNKIMQNTNSDRFTSIKKKTVPPNIKMNKFSSSGIGNFPQSSQIN